MTAAHSLGLDPGRFRRSAGGVIALGFAFFTALGCSDRPDVPPQEVAAGPPQKGEASFYGTRLAGEKTASGAPLDPEQLTAASPTLPLGTKAKVTNVETGKSTAVTVTDRGPSAEGRIIDVTPEAAERLGMRSSGVADVVVQPVKTAKPPR